MPLANSHLTEATCLPELPDVACLPLFILREETHYTATARTD